MTYSYLGTEVVLYIMFHVEKNVLELYIAITNVSVT